MTIRIQRRFGINSLNVGLFECLKVQNNVQKLYHRKQITVATIKRLEEIHSWQKARELNNKIGGLIDGGRFKRNYKLIDQIERSAGSIMDNIAEGFERSGNREFVQFLYISKGSAGEFRSQLYRALDRNYINKNESAI